MKLYPNSKVYIFCPANIHSGGPELCHQIASTLISFDVQAYMFYYGIANTDDEDDPVHDFYKKYHVPYTFRLEDNPHNILVVPETITEALYCFKRIQCVIWWMSVDNYISHIPTLFSYYLKNPLNEAMRKFFYFGKEDDDINHFAQSEYARQFLKLNSVLDYKIHMVEDYLSQAFLNRAAQIDLSKKENFVAYNPKKGFEVTKQLMELAPDIDWWPIQNMTPAQVQELLASSKVYIDFGEHPGKDRIPREAAVSGCVVIVGKRGAAANDVDINIPDEFKFDISATPQEIIKKIREVFDNFETAHEKQADYRARILDDKNRFAKEVADAFGIKQPPPTSVALLQNLSEKTLLLAEGFLKGEDFAPNFIVDDVLASTAIPIDIILREQNRNYLGIDNKLIELISRDDAKFLYLEGRIKKFALFEPTDIELDELKNFYEADDSDVMIFNW